MYKNIVVMLFMTVLLAVTACGKEETRDTSNAEKTEELSEDPADVKTYEYGEELGLELETPKLAAATVLALEGEVSQADSLNESYVWASVRKKEEIEEINDQTMDYFIPIEDGTFSEEVNLHHGRGEYEVTLMLPSEEKDDADEYFDAAAFDVENVDEKIEREVEFSKYGVENELELDKDLTGWNGAEETVPISGTVGDNYDGERIYAEVEKDGENNQLVFPIEQEEFSGEVPLNYGEGVHMLKVQLESDDEEDEDGTYYESATLYVDNESDKIFPEFTEYAEYTDSGLSLEKPGRKVDIEQEDIDYPIKGEIDPAAPLADSISHVIVDVENLDEEEKATYFFPVEDNAFEGMSHFRFGPGEYEITVSIPDKEKAKGSTFYYTGILSVNHTVKDIEDKRDSLPSRGTESDDPEIVEKAEEVTEGLQGDRAKAKAIYEYVAKHTDYDVEKYEEDVFDLDDSAIETLESGVGICQDYTFLTTALLRSIDIPAHYVEGHADVRHAWVEAELGGEWIVLDPTWGAGYIEDGEFIAEYNEDYFDPDKDLLEETHTREGEMY